MPGLLFAKHARLEVSSFWRFGSGWLIVTELDSTQPQTPIPPEMTDSERKTLPAYFDPAQHQLEPRTRQPAGLRKMLPHDGFRFVEPALRPEEDGQM
jgi:hypothetical protein